MCPFKDTVVIVTGMCCINLLKGGVLHQSWKHLHTVSAQIQYSSFNPEADTPEILICGQMRNIVPGLQVLASKSLQPLLWYLLTPQILLFSYENSDPQSSGPSASLVENAESTEGMEGDSELATEGDVQLEYCCD
jgi:hypothetical protein